MVLGQGGDPATLAQVAPRNTAGWRLLCGHCKKIEGQGDAHWPGTALLTSNRLASDRHLLLVYLHRRVLVIMATPWAYTEVKLRTGV